MDNQVSEEIKKDRSKRLIEVSDELEKKYYEKYLNTTLEVWFYMVKNIVLGLLIII